MEQRQKTRRVRLYDKDAPSDIAFQNLSITSHLLPPHLLFIETITLPSLPSLFGGYGYSIVFIAMGEILQQQSQLDSPDLLPPG